MTKRNGGQFGQAQAETPAAHHTLFPPPDGSDAAPEAFAQIHVTRLETAGPVGALQWFAPNELEDLSAIAARFGGGVYELVARRADGTVYRRIRTPKVPGPMKSMGGEEIPPANPPPVAGAPGTPSDPMHVMMGMFQWMAQQQQTAHQQMVQMMFQQQSQAQAQLTAMITAMQGGKTDVGALVSSVAEVFKQAQPPAQPMQNPLDQARGVVELAKSLPTTKEETVTEIVGAVATAFGTLGAMQANQQQQQQPQQQPALPAPSG
jgi:hypothetical protein